MQTYMIQIRLGDSFQDVYVEARDADHAVAIAKQGADAYTRRWASFVA